MKSASIWSSRSITKAQASAGGPLVRTCITRGGACTRSAREALTPYLHTMRQQNAWGRQELLRSRR